MIKFFLKRKLIVTILFFINVVLLVSYFKGRDSDKILLENILIDDEMLKSSGGNQIFFIESHRNQERNFTLKRKACSVEAAAVTNPDMEVYLIFLTETDRVILNNSEVVEALLSYSNINLRFMNYFDFSKGSKLENFIQSRALEKSPFELHNTANALRILILQKYGGTYMDLDVFSLVPISSIEERNFLCTEDPDRVNNAVINMNEGGRALLEKYQELFSTSFVPNKWGANGPKMLTKALKTFCSDTIFNVNEKYNCGNITVLKREKCYPVHYNSFREFYDVTRRDKVLNFFNQTEPYFVHFWSIVEKDLKEPLKHIKGTAYDYLSKSHCPKIYKLFTENF